MSYLPRKLEPTVQRYQQQFPVVAVLGPRQSGKSTMLLHLFPDFKYVTFDDYEQVSFFEDDPKGFIAQYSDKTIFDEVQKAPKLFDYIKITVDEDRNRYGRFILTGSSQFHLVRQISESLAGRIGLLTLLPYQLSELPEQYRSMSVYKGSYPELINQDYKNTRDWFSAYLDTYINKDLAQISRIIDIRDFRRLISLLAAHVSQEVNFSNYAQQLGVSVLTVQKWISVLEASYIIFLLPSYHHNYGKRIVKRPKCYFYDTGLVAYLTGILNEELFKKGPLAGALFENHVIADILKKELHSKTHAEIFYYRTSNGVEVDLIIDRKNKKSLIEIKLSSTFHPKMAAAMKLLLEENDDGFVLYAGDKFPYLENIHVMNYQDYLLDSL